MPKKILYRLYLVLAVTIIIILILIAGNLDGLNKDFAINIIIEIIGPLIIGLIVFGILKPKLGFNEAFKEELENFQRNIDTTINNQIEDVNGKLTALKSQLIDVSEKINEFKLITEVSKGVEVLKFDNSELYKLIASDIKNLKSEFYLKAFRWKSFLLNPDIAYVFDTIAPTTIGNFNIVLTDPKSKAFDEISHRRAEYEDTHLQIAEKCKKLVGRIKAINPNASVRLCLYDEDVNIMNFIKIDNIMYLIIKPLNTLNYELRLRIDLSLCDESIKYTIESHTYKVRTEAKTIYPNA